MISDVIDKTKFNSLVIKSSKMIDSDRRKIIFDTLSKLGIIKEDSLDSEENHDWFKEKMDEVLKHYEDMYKIKLDEKKKNLFMNFLLSLFYEEVAAK